MTHTSCVPGMKEWNGIYKLSSAKDEMQEDKKRGKEKDKEKANSRVQRERGKITFHFLWCKYRYKIH